MKGLFLLFIIYLSSAELVTNATVEIYYDSHGGVYLNYEQGYINQIVNHQNFKLSAGNIKATFEIKDHEVTLLHYYPQPKPDEPVLGAYSSMYGKTLYIGIFRGAQRKDPTRCTPVAKAREYVRYVELGMRIWSANQFRLSQGDDLYISSKCLVIDEAIYVDGNSGKINNALSAAAAAIDKVPALAVRWYITDDYPGGWMGLAAVGSPGVVANRNSNYWLICKYNPSVEDPGNEKLTTVMHEFGHSTGFGHGGTQDASATGTFYNLNPVDNYYDCSNIMGNCAPWDRTITAAQYFHVVVGSRPEPWYFKYPEQGKHKYRLYAFDHPYSRYFLGTSKAFHNNSEVFDGIEFGYSCLGIRILVNSTMTSKYTGAAGTNGYLMLEYKWNSAGQQSAQDFGVRTILGFHSRGNLLMANMDHLQRWGDSEIVPGVDYYPSDFDVGTFRVRVLKVHRTVLKESKEKEIVKEDVREYDEPGYVDLEIESYPNKKYTPPSPPKGIPNFIFSPSFYNCKKKDDESGYTCEKSTTASGWYYFINNGNRDKNIPRLYTSGNGFIRGRVSLRSYNGADYSNSKVCYGDNGFKCITVNAASVGYSGVTRANYQNAKVTRTKLNDVNSTVEDLGYANVIFGSGLTVPEGGRAYITDLYGNEKSITVVDKGFVEILPSLETNGFTEGAVVVKDKDGKVTYYSGFTLYQPVNDNRVAIGNSEDGNFEISPAVMPSNRYSTTTTMLYSTRIKANNWYYYPILYLRDNDYVLIDFRGKVPNGLKVTIETEMGEISRDLSDLGGLSSVSYKLTFMEVNRELGGWAEIDRLKFNKDVEIQNIRPVYYSKVGNQITKVTAASANFNFNGYRYTVKAAATGDNYIYKKVSVEINGKTFSFDSATSVASVTSIEKSGMSGWLIALIVIGVVVVLIVLVFIVKKMKSGNSGSSRTVSKNAYSNRPAYPPPPPMSAYPPPRGLAATTTPGYAGGYPPRGPPAPGYGGTYAPRAAAPGYTGGYRR